MARKPKDFATRLARLFVFSRPFVALWTASTASNLADGFFKLALPLYAATRAQSPSQVAGVMTALTLPWLLFSLPIGSLVDRLDRRLLMTGAHLLRALVLAGVVVFMLNTQVTLLPLYIVAFTLGIAEVVADTAVSAVLPSVVELEELEAANARLVGSVTVGNEFVGPALGGVLFTVSIAAPFGVSAALYLVAAGALFHMRGSFRALRDAGQVQLNEVFEGLTLSLASPSLTYPGYPGHGDEPLLGCVAHLDAALRGCAWPPASKCFSVRPTPHVLGCRWRARYATRRTYTTFTRSAVGYRCGHPRHDGHALSSRTVLEPLAHRRSSTSRGSRQYHVGHCR